MSANPLNKDFKTNTKGLSSPPSVHGPVILAGNLVQYTDNFPRIFYINTTGILVLKDANGDEVSYNVVATQPFVFDNATEVVATTTCDIIPQW